ncbi:MAG: radical SAM protein [Patescibacteria group bacterium]
MQKKIQNPIDCVIGINYICNSKCIMCDIWQNKSYPEIPAEEYRKLPPSLRDINISGGETFLRRDIVEVIRIVRATCPRARIVISTNGFMPEFIESQMKKILAIDPNIGVAVSLDGVGEMHETIRRFPDAYNKSINTLERLKKLGMTNLRLAFTIVRENVTHFSKVYDEARKRGVQFTHSFAQGSDIYFGGSHYDNHPDAAELKKQYEYIISQELKSWNLKRWARAFYAFSMYKFITNKKQELSNDPGSKFFFLTSDGIVYPSVVHGYPMGKITEVVDWGDLWQSAEARAAREKVRTVGVPAWMICTSRTAIKSHPFSVGMWIMKNKFFGVKV